MGPTQRRPATPHRSAERKQQSAHRIIVAGPKSVGKSTLSHGLVNGAEQKGQYHHRPCRTYRRGRGRLSSSEITSRCVDTGNPGGRGPQSSVHSGSVRFYADSLRSTALGMLAMQEGDGTGQPDSLLRGEAHSRSVAEKNIVRKAALERAYSATAEFRSQLADIAERGNGRIRAVLDSEQPTGQQVSQIVDLLSRAQTEANIRAAACSQEMLGALQSVLDHSRITRSGVTPSAREFAAVQGQDLTNPFTAMRSETLRRHVESVLANPSQGSTTSR